MLKTIRIMNIKIFTRILTISIIIAVSSSSLMAQWSGTYGNGWLAGKYGPNVVRIAVTSTGLQKIPFDNLPETFPKTEANFQLWHRGREVAIISTDNNEIVFYGEVNDGKSDELLFRPGPEARLNTHVSFYSDQGSYILTSSAGASRATSYNGTTLTGTTEPYHFQTLIKTFTDWFSFNTTTSGYVPLNKSYYESYNSWGSRVINGANTSIGSPDPYAGIAYTPATPQKFLNTAINLKNWVRLDSEKPKLELLATGLNVGRHKIQITAGPTDVTSTHKDIDLLDFTGAIGSKITNKEIPLDGIAEATGDAVLRVESKTTADESTSDQYALSYFTITYPQLTDMSGEKAVWFSFKASDQPIRLGITNTESDVKVYNITDIDNPVIISGTRDNTSKLFEAMVPRSSSTQLKVFAGRKSLANTIPKENIRSVVFKPLYSSPLMSDLTKPLDYAAYDYLIITSDLLKEKAIEYATYRASSDGGNYKTLLLDIQQVYDQFNYGEPSPVAIRRFVDYMLHGSKARIKHNLLLIGTSVNLQYPDIAPGGYFPSGVVRLKKELPNEVPSIGDPGSDELLVVGLGAVANDDIPGLPVGRIPAFTADQVHNYLEKVKVYEHATGDLSWRKKVIHLAGAKETGEVSQFNGILNDLEPTVKQLDTERTITLKYNTASSNAIQPANITDEVNSGVGMISYYGHGVYNATQLNLGNISQPSSGSNYYSSTSGSYSTTNKRYPVIYFNGCGVGNIFSSRTSTTLASDWLMTADKGAIVIIASSFSSYVSPTITYLGHLYDEIFKKTDSERKSLGRIRKDVASLVLTGSTANAKIAAANDYDISNIHQAVLFGDPAVRILNNVEGALPVEFVSVTAKIHDETKVMIEWKTAWEKNNSHFVVERSGDSRNFVQIGVVDGSGDVSTASSYKFVDSSPFFGSNYYRIRQVDFPGSQLEGTSSRIVHVKVENPALIEIYPNPVASNVSIKLDASLTLKSWILFDNAGRELKRGKQSSFTLQNYSSGSYVLEVKTDQGGLIRKKLVKE